MSLFCYYMDLSPNNIKRITEWIHAELDYNLLTPSYSNVINNKPVLIENQELKNICAICNHVSGYLLFYKCKHFTCFPCLREYKRLKYTFKLHFAFPTCRENCFMYKIYTYQVKKIKRLDSISMRMFNKAKFICSI